MKILYFDVETTGLDPIQNDIVQLAGLIENNGVVEEEFDIKMQPLNYDTIDKDSFRITGLSVEKLKTYPKSNESFEKFLDILSKYIDRYNKADKLYSCGYNIHFDLEFLSKLAIKNNYEYLGAFLNWRRLDPLTMLHLMDFQGKIKLPDYKLETVCKHFNIPLNESHNAIEDIRATRILFKKLLNESFSK